MTVGMQKTSILPAIPVIGFLRWLPPTSFIPSISNHLLTHPHSHPPALIPIKLQLLRNSSTFAFHLHLPQFPSILLIESINSSSNSHFCLLFCSHRRAWRPPRDLIFRRRPGAALANSNSAQTPLGDCHQELRSHRIAHRSSIVLPASSCPDITSGCNIMRRHRRHLTHHRPRRIITTPPARAELPAHRPPKTRTDNFEGSGV